MTDVEISTSASDWQEAERVRAVEIHEAYKKLVGLIIDRFNEIEKLSPDVATLAKAFAKMHYRPEEINDVYFHQPVNTLMVHEVDGKAYPGIACNVSGFVPLWGLYLRKALEAIELMKEVSK